MHKLVKSGPENADIAVVEIKNFNGLWESGFSSLTEELLSATFPEFGYDWDKVTRYSLGFTGSSVPAVKARRLVEEALGEHKIVLAMGSDTVKALCETKRPLKDYAGCLTENLGTWILPTHHPSVVAMGNYDAFDDIYNHIKRAVDLVTGKLDFPTGETVEWEWIGHNGIRRKNNVWGGYFQARPIEVKRAKELFQGWLDKVEREGPWALFSADTESFDTDHFKPLTMIQIYDGEKAYAFNYGVLDTPEVRPLVEQLFNHPKARFVWHNYKHDAKMMRHWFNVEIDSRHTDTMMYALGLTEKGRQCGLKYLSRQYLNAPFYDEGLAEWLDKDDINYGHIRPDVLAEYGCLDVYYTYKLYQILPHLVEREGTFDVVYNRLLPAVRTLADIEYHGIDVDLNYAKAKAAEWAPRIDAAIKKVQEYAASVGFPRDPNLVDGQSYKAVCGCVPVRAQFHLEGSRVLSYAKRLREAGIELPDCGDCSNKRYVTKGNPTLNVASPKHMTHLAFDILNMRQSNKGRSCAKEFREANEGHPLVKLLNEYKEIDHIHRNFLEGVQRFVREDGKVHPDFLIFGTKTGRLSIKDPAMQTVPSRGKNAKAAKKLFVAPPGYVIVNGDYASLEMFVNAHLTGDEQLLDDLLTKDLYKATAMSMFKVDYEDVTPDQRTAAKPVVLGSGYGIGAKKLANNPKLANITQGDPEVAQEFLDAFWGRYSTWRSWCEKQHDEVFNTGRLKTELGRVRRWNLITEDNQWGVRNQAQNFPGQSVGSDICLDALIRLHAALTERDWGRVILTVHDALVCMIREENLHEAVALMKDIMENPPIETNVPFKVDFEVGYNYGDKVDYDEWRAKDGDL